jgi:hypothetical protein
VVAEELMNDVKQRTFEVNGEKITIRSRSRYHCGNFAGWTVEINGIKYKLNYLTRQEAEDAAYVKWVRAQVNYGVPR